MAEIRVNDDRLMEIRDRLPEMSAQLRRSMDTIKTKLDVIKRNIDSEGINSILSEYNLKIDDVKNEIVANLDTAHTYLTNKLSGYKTVSGKAAEQLDIVNKGLEEMGV